MPYIYILGAADACGAVLKRTADRYVNTGHDIPNAREFYNALTELTSVKVFYVEADEITAVQMLVPSCLQAVRGTMQLAASNLPRPDLWCTSCLEYKLL